ncbi:DUF488 domain-containing protein [Marinobacter sp. AL4B]|uniref:DUF488 domain-containing protein n=1 Tax=Marinobacter sp. AL4B TaxID=2871173 RepID=UPI001CAA532F|nr:DUF488 family protein [Marinobacter sp. AL4B]MBZ0334711.1 DUF488 family protein [Marinobacter sp. AL4B]
MDIRLKRAYEAAARSDGPRILVDRIWPRGVSKEDADIAHWIKGLSPSTELRKWFDHDPDKWDEFQKRYLNELKSDQVSDDLEAFKNLLAEQKRITLVFAAKDTEHNNAVALKTFVEEDKL